MKRSVRSILKQLGMPTPKRYFRKFLLKTSKDGQFFFDQNEEDLITEVVDIEENFLVSTDNNTEAKIKTRGKGDSH